jgi:hypothetical protein
MAEERLLLGLVVMVLAVVFAVLMAGAVTEDVRHVRETLAAAGLL